MYEGFKPPELAWQQIVGNAVKHTQRLMWKGTQAYVMNLRFKGKSSIMQYQIFITLNFSSTPMLTFSTKVKRIKVMTGVKTFSFIKQTKEIHISFL